MSTNMKVIMTRFGHNPLPNIYGPSSIIRGSSSENPSPQGVAYQQASFFHVICCILQLISFLDHLNILIYICSTLDDHFES
ncbi:hypothetical protein M6B38_204805 [Iris pallida]|uniref:Uncharacterized protein n=1 Tax=Iris pallida TaxID=29817 RepID=A0AAX6E7N8_IRIPA|nr:hypothetical protein M6B38_204805 [Iris pallida]